MLRSEKIIKQHQASPAAKLQETKNKEVLQSCTKLIEPAYVWLQKVHVIFRGIISHPYTHAVIFLEQDH